jgi:transposase-like protein
MKQVRKIYDKTFEEKAVQLSCDRTNVSELARELKPASCVRLLAFQNTLYVYQNL